MGDVPSWLVVGLGNPGRRHARHRHNIGFRVVDAWLAARDPGAGWREKWSALAAVVQTPTGRCIVIKPQSYMNRSGTSVVAAASYHRAPPDRIVVVHDELDFEFGRVGVKVGGGHGGHNGVRDIVEQLGTGGFLRVRVGIGRPERGDPTSWVLSDFDADAELALAPVVERAGDAISTIVHDGAQAAQNRFNRGPGAPQKDREPLSTSED
jgi:PTH1 family peptidyl-tRNA hydrolase